MNQILVFKDEAYAAGTPSAVTSGANILNLNRGAMAIIVNGNELFVRGETNLTNMTNFQIVAGIAGSNNLGKQIKVQSSVPINRKNVLSVVHTPYNAPQNQVVEIGPFTWEEEGDVAITISNNSFVGTIQTEQVRISEYKTANVAPSAILDKIVNRINNGTGIPGMQLPSSFMTAAKIGTADANYKLRLTMKSPHVQLSVALGEMFAGAAVVTTTPAIISLGEGADVLATEMEYSGNLGNGGYWGYNEGYFSKAPEAVSDETYDLFWIKFQGEHDTPQNRVRAAVNHLCLAVPTERGEEVKAILANLLEGANIVIQEEDTEAEPEA